MKTKPTRLEIKPIAKSDGVFADHDPQRLNKKQRKKKTCTGCGDYFTCFKQANYDYCRNCAINGNRYAQNQCPECGDSSGIIKFKGKPPRECKLCALNKPKINCFYGCDFMAPVERIMEQHYQQKHALKPKEVKRG